jgi:hypothetical protein
LRFLAQQCVASAELRQLGTDETTYGTANPNAGLLTPVVEPRLSNTTRFPNASTTAWYLMAGPQSSPMLGAFLNGVETPTVETSQTDFNVLGQQYRVYMDFGFSLGDPRAAVKSAGA